MMSRVLALLGLLLTIPAVSRAQSFDPAVIEAGQDVEVRAANGEAYRGRVVEVSPSSLTVAPQSGRGGSDASRTFASSAVQTIKRRDSTAEGFFIGLGGGFAAAWLVRQQMCPNDPECGAIVSLYLGLPITAGGAALGALIDHLHKPTLFESADGRRQVSVAPIIARGTAGAALSMRF